MTGSFRVQLINMGTRAAAYQAKLRSLYDYHLRLLHNIIPLPSGVDIANTIKYFSQTLLITPSPLRSAWLIDGSCENVERTPLEMCQSTTLEISSTSQFSSLSQSSPFLFGLKRVKRKKKRKGLCMVNAFP
uniref:Uncharacterized protein n=1 Tax=Lutzomyia longipalpis TaxID=7200 RepID=A0A1B0CGN5_LUTLO